MTGQTVPPNTADRVRSIAVTSWQDARGILEQFPPGWAFRGQSDSSWDLETSLERVARDWKPKTLRTLEDNFGKLTEIFNQFASQQSADPVDLRPYIGDFAPGVLQSIDVVKEFESKALALFRSRARHHLAANHQPNCLLEWFALMQHHGAPTRLLDWTYSPYVAAYFAVEQATDTCSIWAFDIGWFDQLGKRKLATALAEKKRTNGSPVSISLGYFDDIVNLGPPGVYPVTPEVLNERLSHQSGLFVVHGDTTKSFMENLATCEGNSDDHVKKFDIPISVRSGVLDDLNRMNINRATLFPGLDGLAQSIRYQLLLEGNAEWLSSQIDKIKQHPSSMLGLIQAAATVFLGTEKQMESFIDVAGQHGVVTPEERQMIFNALLQRPTGANED